MGVDDTIAFVICMRYFFESQVRSINLNSLLKPFGSNVTKKQDNTSVIQLDRNGRKSSSKRTKHIVVKHFYITDQLKAGDISGVIYTGEMHIALVLKIRL